jgi:shikimate kinase
LKNLHGRRAEGFLFRHFGNTFTLYEIHFSSILFWRTMKIFIIGPGGVGKTTSGRVLSQKLHYQYIDLDEEFCNRNGDITEYIQIHGYSQYCLRNSDIFYRLLKTVSENIVFVLSSGFLVHEDLDDLIRQHRNTIQQEGISILLLPSKTLATSTEVVVQRQLCRGFGLNEKREREKFIERFHIYKQFGDIQIFSHESPAKIAGIMEKQKASKLSRRMENEHPPTVRHSQ